MKHLPVHIPIYPQNVETFHRDTYKGKISSTFLQFNLDEHTVNGLNALNS